MTSNRTEYLPAEVHVEPNGYSRTLGQSRRMQHSFIATLNDSGEHYKNSKDNLCVQPGNTTCPAAKQLEHELFLNNIEMSVLSRTMKDAWLWPYPQGFQIVAQQNYLFTRLIHQIVCGFPCGLFITPPFH